MIGSRGVKAITCRQKTAFVWEDDPGKMPRFIAGDELGNLKAYLSATEEGATKVNCSDLFVQTNKQKSVQKLAIAESTVRSILSGWTRKHTDLTKLKRRLPPLLQMELSLCIR